MIKHKLKINDAKTEFIIFRSPLLRTDLSSVLISVGDNQILSSNKARDLGVVLMNVSLWMPILVPFVKQHISASEI